MIPDEAGSVAQRLVAFLVHERGGEITINRGAFQDFSDQWEVTSSIDTRTGQITFKSWYAK